MTKVTGESIPIAVRAFASKGESGELTTPPRIKSRKAAPPSEWTLIFDTETTTDAAQTLRFGTYQVRKNGELVDSGIFFEPDVMPTDEIRRIENYAKENDLSCMSVRAFVDDIFYGIGYNLRASIVGFNLPFDISRLAIEHAPARRSARNKIMQGGFTFKLSDKPDFPRVQIKHISSRNAFIQFAAPRGQRNTRGARKKKRFQAVRRGFFLDVKTLAAALTSQSHSLDSLARSLQVESQKHATNEHGGILTDEYIEYAVQDTQTTWECYECLIDMFSQHGLTKTEAHKIHSEASLGKAYLREMGIQPWRQLQPDFPPEMLGIIMSAYYGGRSEVHIRRVPTQVLYCDFLSMYPTVCTLMGLWQFVTAQGMQWTDNTASVQRWLDEIDINDLQDKSVWPKLTTLVRILPVGDIFPIRAKYNGDSQYTIGSNHLTSESPLWYTLTDCIASKLLTGRAPEVLEAITFSPAGMQEDLSAINVAGNPEYRVNPAQGDFFRRLIDLRQKMKGEMKGCSSEDRAQLQWQQQAIKILANSTSYGIFVELNVDEEKLKRDLTCYGHNGEPVSLKLNKHEEPGRFFHPLLATLITGAARLMLAISERLATDAGMDWAFCDTDSMALAKPDDMSESVFYERAEKVRDWFTPLNPYSTPSPLFKIEDENYSLTGSGDLEPLYCYAISSKRYALYNLDVDGRPILRKVSEHGLGHLLSPYEGKHHPTGAKVWQADLWLEIIQTSMENRHPDYGRLRGFLQPAVSRYGATSPSLLRWFDDYNEGRTYTEQVKSFNFLLALQPRHDRKHLKPASPYMQETSNAAEHCFDRVTGESIDVDGLKTYQEALAQYHLHPESKFLNGDYLDSGKTKRRHIVAQSILYIGKEANKWEEQFFTGLDKEAQIEYGSSSEALENIKNAADKYGVSRLARAAQVSRQHVHKILSGKAIPSEVVIGKLLKAISASV